MTSHVAAMIHVLAGRKSSISKHTRMPAIGTNGANGVRKGRGSSGRVRRSTNTPMHTMMKANSVPKDVMWPSQLIGRKPEKTLTKIISVMLDRHGVCHFG